jgi:hypothetical protein
MHTLRCTLATAIAEAGFDQKEREIAYKYTYSAIGDGVMQGDGESLSYRKTASWRPTDPLHNSFSLAFNKVILVKMWCVPFLFTVVGLPH